MATDKKSYKDTLNLPQTQFPMEAKLVQNEPARLKRWQDAKLYEQVLADPSSVDPAWHDFFADYKPRLPGKSGNGAGPVTFIVAPNGSGADRSGQVAIAGQSIEVWQAGAVASDCPTVQPGPLGPCTPGDATARRPPLRRPSAHCVAFRARR